MKRWVLASLVAVGLVAAFSPGRAAAQIVPFPSNFGRPPANPQGVPVFSPYLNLGRTNAPATNYFGVVQPQVQTQQSLNQLQMQQYQLEQTQALALTGQAGLAAGLPLPTGHDTRFGNYLQYYPSTVAGLGGRR